MSKIQRHLEPIVQQALNDFPAVYINGPRQAGKTTLVRDLLTNKQTTRLITFDDLLERNAATQNPLTYLTDAGTPLIIDEVQRVPDLFYPLKKLIDEQRYLNLQNQVKKPNGHYLLTGSANLTVIPEFAKAMVGRMATLTLLPLSAAEFWKTSGNFLQRAFDNNFKSITADTTKPIEAIKIATYPELVEMPTASTKNWLQNYVQKITLDDPRQIYNFEKAERMPILLQALALRAGSLVNDADISRDVGLTATTNRTYRHLLEGTFITLTLRPWYRNISKRLVKTSKIYFYDSTLLSYLLHSTPENIASTQPQKFGHVLENFVLSELLKIRNNNNMDCDILFYQTRDGKEVDFVLENASGKIVGIEVKNSEKITPQDLSGLKELQSVTGKDFVCGIILCNTPRPLPYAENIYLLPFSALWQN